MLKYVIDKKLFGAKHWYIYGGKDEGVDFTGCPSTLIKLAGT